MNSVEGAMVFASLAITVGLILAGFSTVATHATARSLARDAARVESLGGDGRAYATARDSRAEVSVHHERIAGEDAISVTVSLPAALMGVSTTAVTLAEPDQE